MSKYKQDEQQLFFMHIAKTAGTSLIALLDQGFIVDEICPLDRGTRDQFLSAFGEKERSQFKFIRGHFPYSIKNDLISPFLITFLREPVDRSLSEIHHLKRMENQGLKYIDESIKDLTLKEFINHPLVGSHVVNRTTKYLNDFDSIIKVVVPPEPKPNLSLAKERLESFDFIGITERFAESMELLTYNFGYPPIVEYPMLQVSGNREKRDEVPGEIIDQLMEMNRDEIDLYEFGLKTFEKRLDEMRVNKKFEIPSAVSAPRCASLKMDFRRVYPGQGWHVGEINSEIGIIRWSGPELVSYLRIPALVEQEYKISFRVVHALDPDVLAGLTVEMNGYSIALTRRDGDNPCMAIFDGDISHTFLDPFGNNNMLAFKVQRTIRPSDGQINNPDTRQLGLCYNWLRIDPIEK